MSPFPASPPTPAEPRCRIGSDCFAGCAALGRLAMTVLAVASAPVAEHSALGPRARDRGRPAVPLHLDGAVEAELDAFFFSSRRRHTRYIGDWSSDVCSSD